MGRDPWVGGEPVPDLDAFVGGVVVHHQACRIPGAVGWGIEELHAGTQVGRPGNNRSEAVRSDKADTAIGCRQDNGADDAPRESSGQRRNPTSRETEHMTW